MKREIRGLEAGQYFSKDKSLALCVSKTDDCVVVELFDFDADVSYTVKVDKSKADFSCGYAHPRRQ